MEKNYPKLKNLGTMEMTNTALLTALFLISGANGNAMIGNGTKSDINEWPFIVEHLLFSLQTKQGHLFIHDYFTMQSVCTASLISENVVLTASHCVELVIHKRHNRTYSFVSLLD